MSLLSGGTAAFQTHREQFRKTDYQIKNIQRLEASASKFRESLNISLSRESIDLTIPANSISTFETGFENSISQLRGQLEGRRPPVAAVESVLKQASLINAFMERNSLNSRVQNDWRSVKANLDTLSNLYGVKWSWRISTPELSSSRCIQLPNGGFDKLIGRLESDVDTFRTSLTDAFWKSPYDRTRAEGMMNDALLVLKKGIDQLRNQFDSGQLIEGTAGQVLMQATPIEKFMRANRVSDGAQSDWSILRGDLNALTDYCKLSTNDDD